MRILLEEGGCMDRKPSEIVQDFINLIERSHQEYAKNEAAYKKLDDKTLEWAHRFEFVSDKNERNRLATAYQKERKQRRTCKDIAKLYKNIHEYAVSENNKPALKRLKGTLAKQKEDEDYLFGDRKYKVGERDSDDS